MSGKMEIKIRFFAILREILGTEQMSFSFSEGSTCADVLAHLKTAFTAAAVVFEHSRMAVNGHFAELTLPLAQGDEMAVLPPVSGG